MRKKSVFILSVIVLLLFPSFAAAKTDYVPDMVEDFLEWIFMKLPEQARSGDAAFVVYFKFMMWILLFSLFYYGSRKIFKDDKDKKVAIAISVILSLTSTILIPQGMLLFIFKEYATVVSIILGLLPVFLGIYIRKSIPEEHQTIRNIVLILIGVIAIGAGGYFTGAAAAGDNLLAEVGQYAMIGGIIALLFGIFSSWGVNWGQNNSPTSTTSPNIPSSDVTSDAQNVGATADELRKLLEELKNDSKKAENNTEDVEKRFKELEASLNNKNEAKRLGKNIKALGNSLSKETAYITEIEKIDDKIKEWQTAELENVRKIKEKLEKNLNNERNNMQKAMIQASIKEIENRINKVTELGMGAIAEANKIKESAGMAKELVEFGRKKLEETNNLLSGKNLTEAKKGVQELGRGVANLKKVMLAIESDVKKKLVPIIGGERIRARKARRAVKKLKK